MRRLLHALFACVLLVAGMGVDLGVGSNLRPAPPTHACCGGMMPARTPAPAGCPCPQAPAPSPLPGLAPAPLAATVQVEAATDGEASPRPRLAFAALPAPGTAPRLASGDGPARAPALHQRLALLRCWRT